MKKILSIMLAASMVFAMSATAFIQDKQRYTVYQSSEPTVEYVNGKVIEFYDYSLEGLVYIKETSLSDEYICGTPTAHILL